MTRDADILVIGSGIAGLTFALKASRFGSVVIVTKKARAETNTNYARGGIAAVVGDDDEVALHVEDTLIAGGGLCHSGIVEALVQEGPSRVSELIDWGTSFRRRADGALSLGREGGHSRRRIVHAGDRTGRAIESALLEAVEGSPNIEILEDHIAVDLLLDEGRGQSPDGAPGRVCQGAMTLEHRGDERVAVRARATFLASGGCGQVYRHTTNPSIATGDGVAMAWRAGARIANMEFIQFHPTALFPTEDPAFLISEAIRGEGAVLRRIDGEPFMGRHHPQGSLAPRDVVARAVHLEMRQTGDEHAILDVSAVGRDVFERRFPGTAEGLRERGIDPHRDGIAVVPAAHYVCGGVLTDRDGRSSLHGLWAAGEVACTGVHGANRLASNSLLEAVVFSHRATLSVETALASGEAAGGSGALPDGVEARPPARGTVAGGDPDDRETAAIRDAARDLMWERAGIVRTATDLEAAWARISELRRSVELRWLREPWQVDRLEVRNLITTAGLIVASARARRESRGLHHRLDHPWRDNEHYLRDTVLVRRDEPWT